MSVPRGVRWLIVVREEQHPLHRLLSRHFETDPRVAVILDRRRGERRQWDTPVENDRRRADRRQSLGPRERDIWQTFGYRLVVQREAGPATDPDP